MRDYLFHRLFVETRFFKRRYDENESNIMKIISERFSQVSKCTAKKEIVLTREKKKKGERNKKEKKKRNNFDAIQPFD